MIVEDVASKGKAVAEVLELRGAIEEVRAERYDLIMRDMLAPVMKKGLEFSRPFARKC